MDETYGAVLLGDPGLGFLSVAGVSGIEDKRIDLEMREIPFWELLGQ